VLDLDPGDAGMQASAGKLATEIQRCAPDQLAESTKLYRQAETMLAQDESEEESLDLLQRAVEIDGRPCSSCYS
jgi:hypothetical protein